jgi:hypothetical protein
MSDFLDSIWKRVKKDWSVLKRARASVALIGLLALGIGGYVGFWLTEFVFRERIATLQAQLEAEKRRAKAEGAQNRRVLEAWGGTDTACAANVALDALADFQKQYDALYVCGIIDPSVDRMADARISISQPLAIRPEKIRIEMPLGAEMREAQKILTAPMREEFKKTLPPGVEPIFTTNKWHEIVLVPKGTKSSDIRKMMDITFRGGKILSQDGWGASGVSMQ